MARINTKKLQKSAGIVRYTNRGFNRDNTACWSSCFSDVITLKTDVSSSSDTPAQASGSGCGCVTGAGL
ncbi:hypothetical protein F2P79_007635 [Pimephales promelas]|nr:hypothetical protein F2P79_007635 [Pimephales promelas]